MSRERTRRGNESRRRIRLGGPKPRQPIPLAKGWRTRQRNKKLGLHRGQGEFKDPKPYGKEGRSVLDHKSYERIYELLVETRSAASRARTTARKTAAEHQKRKRTGKSIGAYGAGKRAAKELATSKVYKKGAKEFKKSATEPVGSPRRPTSSSAGVLRKAAAAMERHSSLKRATGERLISHGKSYKKNLQAAKVSEGHQENHNIFFQYPLITEVGQDPEGEKAWEGFWKDKGDEGKKKLTKAMRKRAKKKPRVHKYNKPT